MSVKLGLIGCGAAAFRYYASAFAKFKSSIAELHLVDKNIELAKKLSAEIGIGAVYSDYRVIMDKVDAVIIVLPHQLHFPVAMEFIKAGVHVLCEKPLSEQYEQVRKLDEAAQKHHVQLCVNNTRRMFPAFGRIKEELDRGRIGYVKSISYIEGNNFAWPSETGFYVDPSITDRGILLDLGPHVLDTICWWMGGVVPEVVQCEDDSFGGPESVVDLKLKADEVEIDIFLNRLLELRNSYTIVGSKGIITGKIFDWNRFSIESSGKKETINLESSAKTYPDFVLPIFKNFLDVVEGGQVPVVSAAAAACSVKLIEDAYAQRQRMRMPGYNSTEILLPDVPTDGRILVTGATGFIGCRIIEMLYLAGYKNMRAAIHKWSSAARLGRFPVDIVQMDLLEKEQIDKALEGVSYVIHCAKGTDGATDRGTENILERASLAEVKHFIHMSTTEVFGNAEGKIYEDAPYEYTGNEYNRSKIEAEKACWKYHEKGMPVTVIRPSIVYGIFSNNWTVRFAKRFLEGKGVLLGKYGNGFCNLIYVDDLVASILNTLGSEQCIGKAINSVGPDVVTWNEYFERFNKAFGFPPLNEIPASKTKLKTIALEPVRYAGRIVKNNFMGPVKALASISSVADSLLRKTEKTLKDNPGSDELVLFSKNAIYKQMDINGNWPDKFNRTLDSGINQSVCWLYKMGF